MKRRLVIVSLSLIAATGLFCMCLKHFGEGARVKVKEKKKYIEGVWEFDLSFDGQKIAWTDTDRCKVWVTDLDTRTKELILHSPKRIDYLRWSPDKRKLAFWQYPDLIIMDLTDRNQQVVTHRVDSTPSYIWWSPDGKRLAWTKSFVKKIKRKIFLSDFAVIVSTINRDIMHQTVYRSPAATATVSMVNELAWSPDGNTLLLAMRDEDWTSSRIRAYSRLKTIKPDGSGLKVLELLELPLPRELRAWTEVPPLLAGFPKCPQWSPDGKKIAYIQGKCIWTIEPDGTNRKELFRPAHHEPRPILRWSPDGKGLLFVYPSGIEGGSGYEPPGIRRYLISPDELHWINSDGTGDQVLLKEEQEIRNVQWRSANEIIYQSGETLWLVRLR